MVRYVVQHFGRNHWDEQRDFWQLVKEEKKFEQKTVGELMTFKPSGGLFVPVVSGYSAFAVMETMARERSIRRVPVVNNRKEGLLVNLVTQSQCVRWLANHINLLGAKQEKPVALCPVSRTDTAAAHSRSSLLLSLTPSHRLLSLICLSG